MNIRIIAIVVSLFFLNSVFAQDEIPVIPADQIPKAVSLEDIEDRELRTNFVKVNAKESTIKVKNAEKINVAARMIPANVYTGTLSEAETAVYFIQLAALYNSRGNISSFKNLGVFGNLYKQFSGNAIKIKLGYFDDKIEARDILRQIKSMGYRDAFITQSQINAPDLELVHTGSHYIQPINDNMTSKGTSVSSSSAKYKVRLESNQNAVWFDSDKVEDLGEIEQWTKGTWTIFVLSSYNSLEEASRVRDLAMKRGFHQAEVVLDNNGILEKVSY